MALGSWFRGPDSRPNVSSMGRAAPANNVLIGHRRVSTDKKRMGGLSLSLQLTWKEDEIFRCLKRRGYCKGSIKNPIHFFLGENMPWGGFKLQTVMKRYCTLLWIYCVLFWTYPWFSSPFQKKSGVTLHPNISAVQEHVFGSKGNSCNLAYSKVQARRGQGRHLF